MGQGRGMLPPRSFDVWAQEAESICVLPGQVRCRVTWELVLYLSASMYCSVHPQSLVLCLEWGVLKAKTVTFGAMVWDMGTAGFQRLHGGF